MVDLKLTEAKFMLVICNIVIYTINVKLSAYCDSNKLNPLLNVQPSIYDSSLCK